MVGATKKKKPGRKKIDAEAPIIASRGCDARDEGNETCPNSTHIQVNRDASQDNIIRSEDNSGNAIEDDATTMSLDKNEQGVKKSRGATKMKKIAAGPTSRIEVELNAMGEPIGESSVTLSSYLGPLVREHVPVTLEDWRLLGEDLKVVLWENIQARFKLDEEWKKKDTFQHMGYLWRASKSRLVKKINSAATEEQMLQLKPDNIKSTKEWMAFIKSKKTLKFKARSEIFKAMRRKQTPHTCSRKGMTRLAEDMKTISVDPTSVSRAKVWIKSRTRKNGEPVNTTVVDTIEKIQQIESKAPSNSTTNVREDALSQVLGQDKPGRLRAMGRGVTMSKVSILQVRDNHTTQLNSRISELEDIVRSLVRNQANGSSKEGSVSHMSKIANTIDKCELLDWSGIEEIVAEGHVLSSDPNELVNQNPLGPNAKKVLIDITNNPDAFLWRPTPNMTCLKHVEDGIVAWPSDRVVLQVTEPFEKEDNMSKTSNTETKCKVFDWTGNGELIAEGRLCSSDPKLLINNIPLGPFAVIVWIDTPKKLGAYLWRPTPTTTCIEHVIGSKIAWPESKIVVEKIPDINIDINGSTSPSSVNSLSSRTNKCKLLDVSGTGNIVAEGKWITSDPNEKVHCVPLGKNAMKVWVLIPTIPDAPVWRRTSEHQCIEDAIGSTIAWPANRVIMESTSGLGEN